MPYANIEDSREQARRYYRENRERKIAMATAWNKANKEKRQKIVLRCAHSDSGQERSAVYYEEHRAEYVERARRWAKQNPDKSRKIKASSRKKHPEAGRRNQSIRRARKRGAFVEIVDAAQVLERGGGMCALCEIALELRTMHLDHIVSLAMGGEHSYFNIQPLCPACNALKGWRWIL